jgi:hypothetical protein
MADSSNSTPNSTSTKRKPRKRSEAKRTLSEALIQSRLEDDQDALTCEIPKGTINDLNKMAKYLGLSSGKTVSEFLKTPLFLEPYNELFDTVMAPKHSRGEKKQGPMYSKVAALLLKGEEFGNRKYSAKRVDKSGWSDADHYAYCLYQLRNEACHDWNGLFRGKMITTEQIDVRLWLYMLRATKDRAPSIKCKRDEALRKARERKERIENMGGLNVFGDQQYRRSQSPSSGDGSPKRQKGVLGQAITDQAQCDPELPPQSSGTDDEEENSLFVSKTQPRRSGEATPASNSRPQDNNPPLPRSPGSPVPEDVPLRQLYSGMEYLTRTKNPNDPFDLRTAYGVYMTVYAVLSSFDDKIRLEQLCTGPKVHAGMSQTELCGATVAWEREMQAIIDDMPTINLSLPTDEELEKFSKWERIFDNKAFQPMDYFDDCIFLGMDPEQPRLPGMRLQD